jgi:purine-nucleoside phosphorylase
MQEFADAVRSLAPRVAVVLGSGITLEPPRYHPAASILFAEVPGLTSPSVAGHAGRISVGKCAGTTMLVFHGRLHYYEGHPWERVGMPIRIAADLGVKTLLLTNAAGGIHQSLTPGSLMVIRDHLNWQKPWSWRGRDGQSGYSSRLIRMLQDSENEKGRRLLAGVYAAVTGPSYETAAEIRALAACGADAVGMSTAHEVETASALGLECAAVSCITNRAAGLSAALLTHQEVIETARQSAEHIGVLIERFVQQVGS